MGPRTRHTNVRLVDYNIMTLQNELDLAEYKLIYKWQKQEIPTGLKDIIEEKNNQRLRNRGFKISKKWKQNSIAFRLGKTATKIITEVSQYKNTKILSKKFKERKLDIIKQETCRVRNCYICNLDPQPPAA